MEQGISGAEKWEDEINLLIERSKNHSSSEDLIAFYGSSSIRLWKNMREDLHPYNTINLGFGGSSYLWCDYFFESVFEYIIPSRVVLYAGDNDLGTGIPQSEIIDNLNRLLNKISFKYGNIPVSIISVKPSPSREYLKGKMESLNGELAKLSVANAHYSYINIYAAMLDENGQVRPELYLFDHLHMSRRGYEVWKEVIRSHLDNHFIS